jgi:hypothetical protein
LNASDAADTFSTKLTIFNAKLERVTLQLCFVKDIDKNSAFGISKGGKL